MGSMRPTLAGFGEDGGRRGGQAGRGGRGGGGFHSQQYQQRGRGAGSSYHHYPQGQGQGAAHQPRGAMSAMQQWRPAGPAAQSLGHRRVQPRHHNGGGRGGHGGDGPSAAIAPDISASPEAPRVLEVVTQQIEVMSMEGGELSESQEPIPLSRSSYQFPRRPGSGRVGTKCLVKANHFLAQLPDKDLHQYDVCITPEITSRVVGRAVMQELVKLHKESYLGGRLPAYDGRNSMYTAGPLPFTSKEFHITLLHQDDGSGLERRGRTFKVVIRFAARANLHLLEQYIAGKQAEAPQEALQVLDIVLRQLPTARYQPCGRSFFSPDLGRRRSLGDGIESWRGFYQTIRPTQMGLSLNINMSSTSFFEPLPVIDFVAQLLNTAIHSRSLSDPERAKVCITPEITSRVVGRAVMQELVKLHKESYLGGRLPAYDGRNSMYTAGPLPFTSKEFHITLLHQDDGSGLERRGRTFKVVIRFAARANLHLLEQYIAGKQAEAPQEALQVLDIVLRQLPTARYQPCGRSFFSPDLGRRRSLGDGIESWRGFYQTIRPTQMGLSLNINMSSTSFFEPLPVIDFVAQLLNTAIHSRSLSDPERAKVCITPEITSRVVGRAVMQELVKLHKESYLGGRLPAYDGRNSMYTAGPLPFTSKEFHITLLHQDDGSGLERRGRTFKVVIRFAARANLHLLEQYIAGKQAEAPQEALQVLDIVLRQLPTARYQPCGRSFFSPDLGRRRSLGDGIESWRGFYQTIRPTQMGLSLNINMSSTSFFEPLPVIDFVAQLLNTAIHSRSLSDPERAKIKKALKGVKVEVTHRGNIRRTYRISGLTSQATRELSFPVDQGGTVKSVVQYFQETYGFAIQHTYLPCLQVGNQQRPNYLPMEVCKIVEGQRYSKRLNQGQIRALLEETCQRPHDRERDIIQMVNRNSYHNDPYAKEFGIKISERLALVEARVLPAPRLKYNETGREKDCLPRVGQWNMMNKKMVNGGRVRSWLCVNFARSMKDSVATGFCRELARMCQASGMDFSLEPVIPAIYARPDQAERALKARFHDAMTILGPERKELELLIGILPDNNGSLYDSRFKPNAHTVPVTSDLKRVCETDLGLISQCCLTKQVFKMNKQILANLALKINVKVGGRNTVLADAVSRCIPLVTDRPTIIFGADVTHPHPGEDSSPSIAAVVASQDWPEVTKYAGLVSAQSHRQEIIEDLYNVTHDPQKGTIHGGMIRELLISFKRSTREKPQRILFYRDGVSEGQFYQVLLHELDAIRKACASLEPNYQPLVTFIVVQKRHHTRLFAHNHNDQNSVDRSGNVLPGTVVDSKICHPTEFDFFLCSHAGIKGTSRPAHYHVLWDENNFTADALQTLTNNLCYTYARCTRSVSIVPPAYYAHLAAFRARFYMEPDSSDSGSTVSARDGGQSGSSTSRSTRAAGSGVVRPLPALKDSVKRVMFYC